MRRMMIAAIAAITLMWSAVPAMATLTPVKVVGGPGDQYGPSSNGTYLAWSSLVNNTFNLYVKTLPSGTPQRVNPSGTSGENGSFVGSSNVLVYNQWAHAGGSDIWFYDVSTGSFTEAPAAVSKPQTPEWGPFASDNYILFMRDKWSSSGKLVNIWVLLYDRNSGEMTTLESGLSKDYYTTFAGNTYVAWDVCGSAGCSIHYWSEAGGEHVQPTVGGREQDRGWIDEATGEIYFGRFGNTPYPVCKGSTIRRADLGSSTSTILATLPPGFIALGNSLAPNVETGHQDLYFHRWSCKHETGDIYALRGVDTV